MKLLVVISVYGAAASLVGALAGTAAVSTNALRHEQLRARHQKAWGKVAREFGLMPILSTDPKRTVFRGKWNGRPVEVLFATQLDTGGSGVQVSVTLPEDVPRHFELQPSTVHSRMRRSLVGGEISLPDAALDHDLEVRGTDDGWVAAVLTYPTVADALRELLVQDHLLNRRGLFSRDRVVSIERGQVVVRDRDFSSAAMRNAIQQAIDLSRVLSEQRTVWKDLSDEHMLEFYQDAERKELIGTVDGEQVIVTSRRSVHGWSLEVVVRVSELARDVVFEPGTGDSGDPIVDRFFRTGGSVQTLLSSPKFDEARERLVEAHHTWPHVEVRIGRVLVRHPLASQAELEPMVDAAVGLSRALGAAASAVGSRGRSGRAPAV